MGVAAFAIASANGQTVDTVDSVNDLMSGDFTNATAISLLGYRTPGDGGQGILYQVPSAGCSPDGGLEFQDGATPTKNCWKRDPPAGDVRQWGAYCDVNEAVGTGNIYWTGSVLQIQDTALKNASRPPKDLDYIVIAQIGGPTLGVTTGSVPDAAWATKLSSLSNTGSGYAPGDIVAFDGGSFSQQLAIVVDTTVPSSGAIADWHFLWGGLYDTTATLPTSMNQSMNSHTSSGSGATFSPVWSGWSLVNNTPFAPGSGYAVGDVLQVTATSSSYDSLHPPTVVVEAITNTPFTGIVTAFDWKYYGTYQTLPSSPQVLSTTALTGIGMGFTIGTSTSPAQWTRGPFATTIPASGVSDMGGVTTITLNGTPGYPTGMGVAYVYYGSDDGTYINKALQSGVTNAITVPGRCGTTISIELPGDSTGAQINPALVGLNFLSTGLYALAVQPSGRAFTPVLSRLLHKDISNAYGGGFSNMTIEGGGLPQGVGYLGLYQNTIIKPSTYVGPTSYSIIPSSGDVVEIDGGKYMRIRDLYIKNALGSGNSMFHCSFDESNPGGNNTGTNHPNGSVGNIVFEDSRADVDVISTTNPSFAIKLENNCHDSIYRGLSAYDGSRADFFQYNGNLVSQLHVNSDAANSGAQLGSVDWVTPYAGATPRWPLAGIGDYGVYTIGNSGLTQTQCDIASLACVDMDVIGSNGNPGQITDTQVKCGSYVSVPPTYYGVRVSIKATNESIQGTGVPSSCNFTPGQIIHADGLLDPTISICNNSTASLSTCIQPTHGFASGGFYTQKGQTTSPYASITLTAGRLYAIPFESPLGGQITKLSMQVTAATGSPTSCEMGIYNVTSGAPSDLVADSGSFSVGTSFTGVKTENVGKVAIKPATPYALVLGCAAAVTVSSTTPSAASLIDAFSELVGATSSGSVVSPNVSTYFYGSYSGAPLPSAFTATGQDHTDSPNVWVSP